MWGQKGVISFKIQITFKLYICAYLRIVTAFPIWHLKIQVLHGRGVT
jgi:hypothetical protein